MSISAIKMLFKAIGLDANAIEEKALDIQKVVLEFDMQELRAGLQTILDYKRDQAQNELRLIAIVNHLGIVDPVLLEQLAITNEGTEHDHENEPAA